MDMLYSLRNLVKVKKREPSTPKETVDFIKDMREKYPRIGKEKLKPLLDKFCKEKNLKTVSESTIGNKLKGINSFIQRQEVKYTMTLTLNGHKTVSREKRD